MKYLFVLFIFLCAFTVFVMFTVIAEGDIENFILSSEHEIYFDTTENTEDIYIETETEIQDDEIIPGGFITETEEETEEKEIFISVMDAKTGGVNVFELEEYLRGVVFSEMPSSFEREALKAQAVAARSYCVYKIIFSTESSREEHNGADICNDFRHCKDYISYEDAEKIRGEENIAPLWEKVSDAVFETKGEIITYLSEPAIAVFHAISGKETESAENIWGNYIPYLVSVDSEEQNNIEEIRNYATESMFSADEFKERLTSNGFDAGFSGDAAFWIDSSGIVLNSSGRVDRVKICGEEITGRKLREIFSLRSTDFVLEYKNRAFIFTVRGYGHGVGMSQYGANLMALDGRDYRDILTWYYTGVKIDTAYKFF
ncbi:MAG: stage II sporulation protein D [Oscillospiraceae bacterium]|nr:stage II sporulation protein D [Oscillospiraceae bacterium]